MTYKDLLEKLEAVSVNQWTLRKEIEMLRSIPFDEIGLVIGKAEEGLVVGGLQEDLLLYFRVVEELIVKLAKEVNFNLVEYEVVEKRRET